MPTPSPRLRGYRLLPVSLAAATLALAPSAFASNSDPGGVVARDAYSTTTRDGSEFRTRAYPEPINFKADDGSWEPIDRSLVHESDGSVHPAAVDGDAGIPASIAHPVVIEHGGRKLSFDLRGASGGRELAGTKAKFDDALAGVDVAYKVRSNGLKETLTLASAAAQRSFTYDVSGDADLAAAVGADGELVFTDRDGRERFRVAAPIAWDSADPTSYANALELSVAKESDGRWTVTLKADDEWLDDPARVYPVMLDPDYYWVDSALRFHGANQDCYLASNDQANNYYCSLNVIQVGQYNRYFRGNFKFDVASAIPKYATATKATFLLWQPQSTPKGPANMRLRTLTRDWDNTATWNQSKKNVQNWTTPGGDVSTDPSLIGPPTTVGAQNFWYYWDAPLAAVNGWIKGTLPNYGLQLSTDPGSPSTTAYGFTSTDGDQALWPALDVTWTPDTVKPSSLAVGGDAGTDGAYLPGAYNGTITASAQDDAAGISKLQLLIDGAVAITSQVNCPNGLCPLSASLPLSFSTTALGEGDHEVTLRATDAADNVTDSEPWTVTVDRTNPAFIDTPRASLTESTSTDDSLAWTAADDPSLGTAQDVSEPVTYKARYTRNGSTSAWQTVEENRVELAHSSATVTLEVQAIDGAGNSTAIQTLTANTLASFADGSLYTDASNGRVYLYQSGVKSWISSPAAADQYGFDLQSTTTTSGTLLSAIPTDFSFNYNPEDIDGYGDEVSPEFEEENVGVTTFAAGAETGKTYKCSKSGQIRSAPNKYIVGWCMAQKTGQDWEQARFRITGYGSNFFRSGRISGNYLECGWIRKPDVGFSGSPLKVDKCKPHQQRKEKSFSTWVADNTCVIPKCKPKRDTNGDGVFDHELVIGIGAPKARVEANYECDRWANVDVNGHGKDWVGKLPDDADVTWRYKSRRGGFVMIERANNSIDPNSSPTDPENIRRPYKDFNWTFVEAGCVPEPARTTWYDQLPLSGTPEQREAARVRKAVKSVPLRRKALNKVSRLTD